MEAYLARKMIPVDKFNWFTYFIEKHLNVVDADGQKSALHSADSVITILHMVTSTKSDDVLVGELLEMVGDHNIDLVIGLNQRRAAIKTYVNAANKRLEESQQPVYRGKNMEGPVTMGVSVTRGPPKGKKGRGGGNRAE